ncbi:MAG: hypothetical protein N2510_07745 [Ignavibacteria bacterium]|nr:hypothetical protein [Ignavibacteria bacterium]
MIWTLKNDVRPFPLLISNAKSRLREILINDLAEILRFSKKAELTVCIVPRAKREDNYRIDQLYFKEVVSNTVDELINKGLKLKNGIDYIKRHTNTRTTHLREDFRGGPLPYVGITRDTCTIQRM